MKLGGAIHESLPWVRRVHHLDEARAEAGHAWTELAPKKRG